MRVLALDYGTARIGVAVSDPEGIAAQPLEAISGRSGRRGGPLDAIGQLVRDYEVERIVIGLPLHMEGQLGEQARAVQAFGGRVAERTGVPVEFLDERWTTREAERALDAMGLRGARRRALLDGAAAAILLRTFLERRRSSPTTGARSGDGQAPPGARSEAAPGADRQAGSGVRGGAQRSGDRTCGSSSG